MHAIIGLLGAGVSGNPPSPCKSLRISQEFARQKGTPARPCLEVEEREADLLLLSHAFPEQRVKDKGTINSTPIFPEAVLCLSQKIVLFYHLG